MKRKEKVFILIIIFSISLYAGFINETKAEVGFAELVLRTNGGGVRPYYAEFIVKYLNKIGIEVQIRVDEWLQFTGALLETHDYDMGIVSISGGGNTPDMRNIYTENGNMNIFGLDSHIPYGNLSETMQEQGSLMMNLQSRQQLYYNWQYLMMDKILPMLPLFTPQNYVGTWVNTFGYDASWGLINSLPYMYYDGYHEHQDSLNEFRIADTNWYDLNPMFIDNYPYTSFISKLLNEELVILSPGFEPLKTGLVRDWEQIDDYHFKFYMRDNVFWNPSYNITNRDENSPPLSSIPSSELIRGLKNNQYSDGTNQQVTAKDAVFTLLLWGNSIISEDTTYHEWISNIYVDPTDELAFHIYIDKNPATPKLEVFPDFWKSLNWIIMPEFFLNSSNQIISYSSGGVKCTGLYNGMEATPQWRAYSTTQFGCGKYMLDYRIFNDKTVLQASPFWMGIGAIDGIEQNLQIEKIIVDIIVDSDEELEAFQHGLIDWIGLTAFPSIRRMMDANPKYFVQSILSQSMSFLFFNLKRPFIGAADNWLFLCEPGKEEYTKGVAVRKVICYSIDREEINERLHNGEYVISNSIIYPYLDYYYNDTLKYYYDLDKVNEWFISAAYPIWPLPDSSTISSLTDNLSSSNTNSLTIGILTLVATLIIMTYCFRRKKGN